MLERNFSERERNNLRTFHQFCVLNNFLFRRSMAADKKRLNHYLGKVRRSEKKFPCSKCGIIILSKEYEEHCTKIHSLNSKIHCVWCWGAKSWKDKEKQQNANHLMECFTQFIDGLPEEKKISKGVRYEKTITGSSVMFSCPECRIQLLPKDYESHCTKSHHLDSTLQCVWCRGAYSWIKGEKKKEGDHLLMCFRKFMYFCLYEPLAAPERRLSCDPTAMCLPKNFLGHSIPGEYSYRIYDYMIPLELVRVHRDGPDFPFYPEELDKPPEDVLTFQDTTNLNLAVSYIRYFLKHRHDREFFHVMVKYVAYENFMTAMEQDLGVSRMFKFSCWCDGGKDIKPEHRQHKHMIVVSDKDRFIPYVWKKNQAAEIFTLQEFYVPSPETYRISPASTAHDRLRESARVPLSIFFGPKKSNENHFYITAALPRDYKIVLATQWDGGLLELVTRMVYKLSDLQIAKSQCEYISGQWRIRVRDIPGIVLNLVLPVDKHFRRTTTKTDYFIHLVNERKIYFEKTDHPNEDNNNDVLLYYEIANEYVTLRKKHQKFLTNIFVYMERIRSKYNESRLREVSFRNETERSIAQK